MEKCEILQKYHTVTQTQNVQMLWGKMMSIALLNTTWGCHRSSVFFFFLNTPTVFMKNKKQDYAYTESLHCACKTNLINLNQKPL